MTLVKKLEAKIEELKLELCNDLIAQIDECFDDIKHDLSEEYEYCPENFPNAFYLRQLLDEIDKAKISLEISYKEKN